ncbi:insulinase family protein [Chryseobacterium sp. POL2]|uniref:M16 family metallopeptidase n=1 Tax=Chryseobacterium sp. POL2 TaxID=2713414 RepID=UPI0013E20673|nr:pitrilysin family protein [Chryseobacterium sp. POL2]QIG90078.1 insulinase family protein [Chryseobacterium sp. POL2]
MKKQLTYIAASFLISGMTMAQKLDLNAMPKPGPTPSINIATPKTFKLNNGLTVMVVENHKLPRVNVSLSMDRPPVYEANIAGVNSIMADQLGKGTMSMSKDDFNKRVDFLGSKINFSSNGAFANTLTKYFPEVLGLLADAAINPKFTAEEVQKSKERSIEALKLDEKNAKSIASKVSNAIIYGKNTARGEFETEATNNAIQLKDVQEAYSKYFAPNNAYLVVVGDVKYKDVKKLIENKFGAWKKSDFVYPPTPAVKNVAKTEIVMIDVPSAVQSVININNISTLQKKDPEFFAAEIADYILGGGGEARLFMNLREKNGFTYGAYSDLSTGKYSPEFNAEASVRNEVTDKAVMEFMNELKGITTIKPEELANAKAKLKGDFIRSMEKPETIAGFAVNSQVYNLPKDFYTNYLKSIDQVTIANVQDAAKAYILPNQSRIFVAGKASEVADSLEKLGYPVSYYDKDANKTSKPVAQKIDVTVAQIADKYITAIGGKTALDKVKSISLNADATVQNMPINMTMSRALGGKSLMDIKVMGNSMQKIVFDGTNGKMMAQGQSMDLPEETKAQMLADKLLFPELGFANNKDLKITGVEKINNEDSYGIKDASTTYYYSLSTGLKTGETKTQKMGGQEMTVPVTFSDYKVVDGVKYPFKMSQSMMGQSIDFIIKDYQINKAKDADFKIN